MTKPVNTRKNIIDDSLQVICTCEDNSPTFYVDKERDGKLVLTCRWCAERYTLEVV